MGKLIFLHWTLFYIAVYPSVVWLAERWMLKIWPQAAAPKSLSSLVYLKSSLDFIKSNSHSKILPIIHAHLNEAGAGSMVEYVTSQSAKARTAAEVVLQLFVILFACSAHHRTHLPSIRVWRWYLNDRCTIYTSIRMLSFLLLKYLLIHPTLDEFQGLKQHLKVLKCLRQSLVTSPASAVRDTSSASSSA